MRILVFQTAYLGDVVLTTPLLATLKKRLPDSYVACVVQPAWAPVLEHSKVVDKVIPFDKRGQDTGLIGTLKMAMKLRKEKFDVVLCPHPSFRSGLILWLSGIPKRIGFETSSGKGFFTKLLKRDESRHEVERNLSLAEALGITEEQWIKKLKVQPDKNLDPDRILEAKGVDPIDAPVVGMHPGSVWATKRWTPEGFAKVARAISKNGFRVIVFGTDNEKSLVDEVVKGAEHESVCSLTGLSLEELIAVYSRLSFYVTNDSGPMHIACALGMPVVCIFGSTVPAQGYGPYSELSAVVETDRLDCRPCGPHGHDVCPKGHFYCMKKVDPKSVLLGIRVLMGHVSGDEFYKVLLGHQLLQ